MNKNSWMHYLIITISVCGFNAHASESLSEKLKNFSDNMASQHQFDSQQVLDILTKQKPNQKIIGKMNRPAESLPWHRYRPIWMKETRIMGGVEFFNKYRTELEKAEKEYGVDKMIIVAIIGVESFYGSHQGVYPVLDALYTLGFHYPKRATFFKSELEEYFILAREQQWELDKVKGSYAGAMGMGQFISSSYRAYGVDFNGDGKVNLFDDQVDMIGSIANYFKKHGWKKGRFVAKQIDPNNTKLLKNVQKQLQLTKSLSSLESSEYQLEEVLDKESKVGVFAFKQTNANEHWIVGKNFYSITRYNHNAMYALAVFQLSEAIREKLPNDKG